MFVNRCTNVKDINQLQHDIMVYVKLWVDTEDTPVPQAQIIKHMKGEGTKPYTTINSINSLLRKGYIRRAIMPQRNKTYYVMLRWVS